MNNVLVRWMTVSFLITIGFHLMWFVGVLGALWPLWLVTPLATAAYIIYVNRPSRCYLIAALVFVGTNLYAALWPWMSNAINEALSLNIRSLSGWLLAAQPWAIVLTRLYKQVSEEPAKDLHW